ncbi:MAG: DUF615 domain-containing protein [Xanthomonadales bacterium]|nr:DUF615 domain-containing protein [Xanthomonadales bacterium]
MKKRQRSAPPAPDTVSKSQLKREAKELFALGKKLSELPETVLLDLPLEPGVLEEIQFARRIKSHVARKRQLGFLAKRLRQSNLDEVQAALQAREDAAKGLTAQHHRAEAWRDHLLERGDDALGPLFAARDDLDGQALRQLLRNAQREQKAGKAPASARKLFRMLRALDETSPLPPTGV